jgi:hypothetical protein
VFTLFQFSGSLDEWLTHEREKRQAIPQHGLSNPDVFPERDIRDVTVAGRPAKVYPPIASLSGRSEIYVLKLTDSTLLQISIDDRDNADFRRVVDGVRIKTP